MVEFSGIQFSILEVSLAASVFFFAILSLVNMRRVSALESKLQQTHSTLVREIKMVNQGSIGMGRRFATIEKRLKNSSNVAQFETAKELKNNPVVAFAEVQATTREALSKPVQSQPEERTRGLNTRAERALSAWINEHQTAS